MVNERLALPVDTKTLEPLPGIPWALELHVGWWDAGVSALAPNGLIAGVGVPWIGFLLAFADGENIVPVDARVGYAYALSPHLRLSTQILGAYIHVIDSEPLLDGPQVAIRKQSIYIVPSVGVSYLWDSGIVLGINLVPYAIKLSHQTPLTSQNMATGMTPNTACYQNYRSYSLANIGTCNSAARRFTAYQPNRSWSSTTKASAIF